MSVLLPDTVRILRTVGSSRLVREGGAEDRATFADVREWLAGRPHVAWCRCGRCAVPEDPNGRARDSDPSGNGARVNTQSAAEMQDGDNARE